MSALRLTPEQYRQLNERGKKSRSKYGAKKVLVDGITFDSKREAQRYHELKLMQAAMLIRNLKVHEFFPIWVGPEGCEVFICYYQADFVYENVDSGRRVVEDTKGLRTDVYKLKKKLMKAVHGIEIREI